MPGYEKNIEDAELLSVEERLKVVDSLLHSLNPSETNSDRLWVREAR